MNPRIVSLLAVASVVAVSAAAHARLARSGEAQVSFTALGPAGMSIVGTTSELQVTETDQELVVTVPLRTLDTKIDLRNKHMREKYLEVDKFPNAELRVAKSAITAPKGAPVSGKTTGNLTIHGQTKPTAFSYTAKNDGPRTAVSGAMHVNMKDFGIAQPGYAGITVKPEVDVAVSFGVQDN